MAGKFYSVIIQPVGTGTMLLAIAYARERHAVDDLP